jgi:lipoate-protein ligase A
MTIVRSRTTDPLTNFALERELLSRREGGAFVLLYINDPCVVVGANQAPEAEADVEWCRGNGIPVLKRISGGGAVWHDHGNINWAIVSNASGQAPLDDRPLEPIIAALRTLGIETRPGPRGELTARGRKISGTAACVKQGRRLFHGTLLWDADLETMTRALKGDPEKRGRKVASRPAPTANLKALTGSEATTTQFMEALAGALEEETNKKKPTN